MLSVLNMIKKDIGIDHHPMSVSILERHTKYLIRKYVSGLHFSSGIFW